ncbi:MAG: Glycerophosphocholine phosphodiesterase [Vezdaea aestivalis]|nr:MAG: Glycerophosphocholine phosphodiesterase [Vezdaea aestivalis]
MKFGRNLQRNQVPEWASNYINYKALKKLIKVAEITRKTTEDVDLAPFFFTLDRNLESVDTFYNKKYGEAFRRLKLLQDRYGSVANFRDALDDAEADELLTALRELRGRLRNLQWYGDVNRRGFVKITKKLDKKLATICAQRRYLESRVDPKPFASNHGLDSSMNVVNDWISILSEVQQLGKSIADDDTMSEKFAPHLPAAFTSAVDPYIRSDDEQTLKTLFVDAFRKTSQLIPRDISRNKVALNLLQRAIACKAFRCISFLLSQIDSLEEPNDINGRNCVHRIVIAIGRAHDTGDKEEAADMLLASESDDSDYITPAATPVSQPVSSRSRHPRQLLDATDPLVKVLQHLLDNLSTFEQQRSLLNRDAHGRIPLHYAAHYGFVVVCTAILEKMQKWGLVTDVDGQNLEQMQDNEGWTPLHIAVIAGHPLTTEVLLKDGTLITANTMRHDLAQRLPKSGVLLLLAVKANYIAIVQLLVDDGADIFYQDSDGESALHVAARFGHSACAAIILDACTTADMRSRLIELAENTFCWTPLFIAAVDGHPQVVDLLCSTGADPDSKDLSGWTPKEHAALRGHIDIAKALASYSLTRKSSNADPVSDAIVISNSLGSVSSVEERTSQSYRGVSQQLKLSEPFKAFGHRYLKHESMVLISLGSMDMRKTTEPVKLDRIPIANAHSTQLDTALSIVVSASEAEGEPSIIDLPVQDRISTDPIVLTTDNPGKVRLLFDIVPTYAGLQNKIVGRAVAILGDVKQNIGEKRSNLQADICVPVLAVDTLDVIGTVNFNFLVITPFSHPNMRISEQRTYWKSLSSTMVIGHRGLGKNILARKSLQLGENTIQSFVAAANLGANYIEFGESLSSRSYAFLTLRLWVDVQLTKDHVPVIYHDFLVSETGIDAPVHTLTLEQFLHVGEAVTPRSLRPPTPPQKFDRRLDWLKDSNKRGRSLSVGARYDDTAADMSERMKHTRDFKLKGFKGNSRGVFIKDSFTTLDEMFQQVPSGTGFNIEMKYPMLHESEEEEMDTYAIDLNTFVDTVLQKVYDKNVGPSARDIIFSSFNPDICLLLSFKQPSIPVLFLTDSGTSAVGDIRASSLQEAIRFASRWNLLGVVTAAYPLVLAPRLIRVVKESGLVCISYGVLNNDPVHVQAQADQEIDAVIVDSLVTVREGLRTSTASTSHSKTATKELSSFGEVCMS